MTIILFTDTFPYGVGEQFLEAEIRVLARMRDHTIIVPWKADGPARPLPEGIEVDTSLSERRGQRTRVAARALRMIFQLPAMRGELRERRGLLLRHPSVLRRVMARVVNAIVVRDWLCGWCRSRATGCDEVVAYSYWLGDATLGMVLSRADIPGLRAISRAHRVDLYDEQHVPPYIPFRGTILDGLDRLFAVSDHGAKYLRARHPAHAARITVARLGVVDPGGINAGSEDGLLRVVSCSFLKPVKRIDLLVRALAELGTRHPDARIEWHHIGDGPLRARIDQQVTNMSARNVRAVFHGTMANEDVLRLYLDQPLDVLVNVSSSEGVPVSVMEALSCGIPVAATAVGGTPEIVDGEVGWLLPANPTAREVADVLDALVVDGSGRRELRAVLGAASRRRWAERSDAEKNYSNFHDELAHLTTVG